MQTLKLTDVQTGTPTPPRRWSNITKSYEPLDACEMFLDRLAVPCQGARHVAMPIDASMYHRNFLEYLEKCWGDHLGIVITPDILWFTLLGELASYFSRRGLPKRRCARAQR